MHRPFIIDFPSFFSVLHRLQQHLHAPPDKLPTLETAAENNGAGKIRQ
jgi:hypothetical protein